MRICLITQSIQRVGGAEALVRELALGLLERGHEILVISIDPLPANTGLRRLALLRISTPATTHYAAREAHGTMYRAYWLSRCLINGSLLRELDECPADQALDLDATQVYMALGFKGLRAVSVP